jgi:tripartite-type tricarboxylate transporter receptor subunit TctC
LDQACFGAAQGHATRMVAIGVLFLFSGSHVSAQPESVADFYRGKQLTIIVGSGAGGGYDIAARVLANHLGRHVPGNPTVVVENMVGAGGRTAANYLASTAPRDGSTIEAVDSFIPTDPLFNDSKVKAEFDPRQFTWIGSITNTTSVAVDWYTAPVKTYADLFKHQLIVGGVGAATPMVTFPFMFDRLFGTKFKVVAGYPSSTDVDLAMEQGEVQGRVDYTWHSLRLSHLDWIKSGKINILFQLGLQKDPDLQNIPLLLDMARTEEQRQILKAAFTNYEFGMAFAAPPALPGDRTIALRKAFMDTLTDPAFLKDASEEHLEVRPVSAERLEVLIREVYGLPPALIARTKALEDPTGLVPW